MLVDKRKVIVLGTHSFLDGGLKVGIQYLAEGLAHRGWQVDYVATASSPFDTWGRKRHGRLKRVWLTGQDRYGVAIAEGLTEYAFKAFFPAHRALMRARWQLAWNLWLAPSWLGERPYELCVHETSPNVVYWPLAASKCVVFRLSDSPAGFAHDLPSLIIQQFESHLAANAYDDIWAVSTPLAQYALLANHQSRLAVIPNGVADVFGQQAVNVMRKPNSAVFLGGLSHWIDDRLIDEVARCLPHWSFDLYGPVSHVLRFDSPNVRVHPPVARALVPGLLAGYEVGLIPFRDCDNRMQFVERPLKFYEYVSAGLGVASTDIGNLRTGMGDLASYGNTPAEFAKAVVNAQADAGRKSPSFRQDFMMRHSWSSVMDRFMERIEHLGCASTDLPVQSGERQ